MTFTYDPTTARGRVRLLVGDTDENQPIRLEDAEVDVFLELMGSERAAAAEGADALAARYARQLEGGSGGLQPSRTRAQELRTTAARLRASVSMFAVPTAGGITQSDRDTLDADTDRLRPAFRRGQLDSPDVGGDAA